LVVAIAGVAIAHPIAAGSKKKKGLTAKQVRNIAIAVADGRIAARAPGLSVARAAEATNATNAGHADTANTANSANPVAFAHVASDGTVDPARSKNIVQSNVTKDGSVDGLYCFRSLGFSFEGAAVTTDYDDSAGTFGPQFGDQVPSVCTPDAQAYVLMPNGTTTADAGFFIVFYG
jgi:hypothetical protein